MTPSKGLARRIFLALNHLEGRLGHKLSQTEAGELVAKAVGRKRSYHQGTVADWLERGVRDVDVLWAIATATGVNFPWLATGKDPMLPPATPGNVRIDVASLEGVSPAAEEPAGSGVNGVQQPPKKPPRLKRGGRRAKDDRPVHKKPPRRR